LVLFQPVFGFVHHVKFKRIHRRTWWSHTHLFIGRVAITLGIINGGIGLALARASVAAITAYSVFAALMWLLWMMAAILGERRRRKAKNASGVTGAAGTEHKVNVPSPPYTPGPLYGGPGLNNTPRGVNPVEMQPVKAGDLAESVSTLSTDTTRRGAQ
jgi:hypothetical protein